MEVRKLVQMINKTNPASLYVLLEVWAIMRHTGSYHEIKAIAKFIYRLLDSPDVPNHLWIKGHIVCAKTLILNPSKPNYEEAINLLKGLCQVLPPLPLPDNIYSIQKNLKMNDTPSKPQAIVRDSLFSPAPDIDAENLFTPPVKVKTSPTVDSSGQVVSRISIIDEERTQYINELQEQKKAAAQSPFETELSQLEEVKRVRPPSILQPHMRKSSVYYQQMALYQEYNRISRVSTLQQRLLRSSRPTMECAPRAVKRESMMPEEEVRYGSELFSVSTQWDYLYLMGKLAIKFAVNYKFGVHVLSDLIGLLSLFCGDNSYTANKAKYYIGVALIKMDRHEDAQTLLNVVMPIAQKQKLKDKIKQQLDICREKINKK